MKTRLVQIGNSRGIRLPKPLIEEAGLGDEVELRVRKGAIVILAAHPPRAGWAEAARALHDQGGAGLLDGPTPTRFDEEVWKWLARAPSAAARCIW
jgi:antitoxin MazE